MKRLIALVIALIFAILPCVSMAVPTVQPLDAVGINITPFSTQTITGSNIDGSVLSEYSLTVLHYFAVWSADSIREMLYIQRAYESFGDDLNVFGLLHEDATSTPEAGLQLMIDNGLIYHVLRLDDVLSQLVGQYNLIPQTFFVTRDGVVVEHFPGTFSSYQELHDCIQRWLHQETQHAVRFVDGLTDELICTVYVPNGGDATPPTPPQHEGYSFVGWQGDYHNITSPITITALYVENGGTYELGDVDMDGRVTVADALLVARYAIGIDSATEGMLAYGDFDGSGRIAIADALGIMRYCLGLQ